MSMCAGLSKILFPTFHITFPNATKYTNTLDINILQSKKEQIFWRRSIGLQRWKWISVHQVRLRDRISRNQMAILEKVWILILDTIFFFALVDGSLLSHFCRFFSFCCRITKQVYSKFVAIPIKTEYIGLDTVPKTCRRDIYHPVARVTYIILP